MRSSTANRAFRSGRHALAALISVAAATVALLTFSRSRPGVRAAIALVFGVLALVNGALHLVHATDVETSGSDVTGVLAVGAGIALLVLGLAIPFVHRGEGGATGARRWGYRLAVFVGGALIVYAFLFPISGAIVQTHKYREPIGAPPSPTPTSLLRSPPRTDWSSRAGTAPPATAQPVVLVHGGGGVGKGAIRHAELLGRRGYGVLLYDSRGRGERRRKLHRVRLGLGQRRPGVRSPFSANARTSTPSGLGGSGCPPEPTSSSRSPPGSAT